MNKFETVNVIKTFIAEITEKIQRAEIQKVAIRNIIRKVWIIN